MGRAINKLTIGGFRSIRELVDFELRSLNVLIGANGAGKSNFAEYFRLLRAIADENLQALVNKAGGADGFFFLGPKHTRQIHGNVRFAELGFSFILEPSIANEMVVTMANVGVEGDTGNWLREVTRGSKEIHLRTFTDSTADELEPAIVGEIYESLSNCVVYHFHDTSSLAPMRREQSARDNEYLRSDASNIAAFLSRLLTTHRSSYLLIRDAIRLIAPFFDDFRLRIEEKGGQERTRLEWNQKGSDYPFQPVQLSDGTIRFICLATALLQPTPPSTIVIDEPELGLHPHALEVLAGLIKKASTQTQVIVSTQSASLLSQFEPEDVIVVTRKDGASEFNRLDESSLSQWLEDYSLGELWQKNYVEGGPRHE